MVAITMEMMIAVSVVMIIAMTAEQLLEVQLEFQKGSQMVLALEPHSHIQVSGWRGSRCHYREMPPARRHPGRFSLKLPY